MRISIPAVVALLFAAGSQDKKFAPMSPDPNGPRPIAAHETLFIEELTWMEVRDAPDDRRLPGGSDGRRDQEVSGALTFRHPNVEQPRL